MKMQQFLFCMVFSLETQSDESSRKARQTAFRGADESWRSAGASKSWLEDVGGISRKTIWVWKNRPFLWINENLSTKMPSKVEIDVSKNRVKTPKSSILIGGFHLWFTIHFGVPYFSETPVCRYFIVHTIQGNWVVAIQIFFIFTPLVGEDELILTSIFQMGLKPPPRESCHPRILETWR